jgi:hypothetical protein
MKSHSDSGSVPKDTRIMRDDPRVHSPHTIRELRYRDVFVEYSRSTR